MMTLFLFLLYLTQKPTTKIWTAGGCTAHLSSSYKLVFTICQAGTSAGSFSAFDPRTLETSSDHAAVQSFGDVMAVYQKNSSADVLHYQVAAGGIVVADCLPQVCGNGACVQKPDACGTAIPW